jgi:YbbR domain-containing protein
MIKKIVHKIFSNFGLKLWSLILAVILWYAIQGERTMEAFVKVEVQVKNRPRSLLITNAVNDSINLLVRGPIVRINELREHPLTPYSIDLTSSAPGSTLFKIFAADFKMPDGVTITRINPQMITVVLERQKSKRLPVHVNFSGTLENGFVVQESVIQPSQVTVVGAESEIDPMQEVAIKEIDLTGVRNDITGIYPLLLKSDVNTWIDGDPQVKVHIKIAEHLITEVVSHVPLSVPANLPAHLSIEPKEVDMVLQGPAGKVNDFKRDKPHLYVQIPELDASKLSFKSLPLKIHHSVPPPCEVVQIIPESVQLKLR